MRLTADLRHPRGPRVLVRSGSVGDVGPAPTGGARLEPRRENLDAQLPGRPGADGSAASLGAARFQSFDAGTQGGELFERLGQCQLQCLDARRRPADGRVPRLPVT